MRPPETAPAGQILGMIRAIGVNSPALLEFIAGFPAGAETLVLRILFLVNDLGRAACRLPAGSVGADADRGALAAGGRVSRELVEAVRRAFGSRELDTRLLVPVLGGFTKVWTPWRARARARFF
jgi:hypothetical protein